MPGQSGSSPVDFDDNLMTSRVSVVDLLRPGIHSGDEFIGRERDARFLCQRRVGSAPKAVDLENWRPVSDGTPELSGFVCAVSEDVKTSVSE
jgi:hypothetical protein